MAILYHNPVQFSKVNYQLPLIKLQEKWSSHM